MNIGKDFKLFAKDKGISSSKLNSYNNYNIKNGYVTPYVLEERNLNVSSLDIYSRLLMDRILFLNTEINSDVAGIVSAQLLWLDQQGDTDITLQISSPGGCIYSGLEIMDTMNFISPDVATISMGMVASMATVLASSGTMGKRSILPHARFLVHQPLSSMPYGQASDLTIHVNEVNTLKKELYNILSNNSGIPYDEIEKMCDRDCILTAQEAVDKGFLDFVITKNCT